MSFVDFEGFLHTTQMLNTSPFNAANLCNMQKKLFFEGEKYDMNIGKWFSMSFKKNKIKLVIDR